MASYVFYYVIGTFTNLLAMRAVSRYMSQWYYGDSLISVTGEKRLHLADIIVAHPASAKPLVGGCQAQVLNSYGHIYVAVLLAVSSHPITLFIPHAAAYKNETFRIITGASSYTIPATNKHKDPYYCHNHHKMIYPWQGDSKYLYDYCTGGKTGFTKVAGSTLVTFAEKDGITLVCVVLNANSPDHYTDTRKLIDYCFENFQALNISENEKSIADEKERDRGLLNNNKEFVRLDKDAYIIMPKAAKFDDAKFEEDKENSDGTIAKLTYTYAGRVVGGATIETTGAKVDENYFNQKPGQTKQDGNVIWVRPVYIVLGIFGIIALIWMIFLIKKLYDNFYLIRHKHELRKIEKERFKVNDRKKRYRKKDRLFR